MAVVKYHEGRFPPRELDWPQLLPLIGPESGDLNVSGPTEHRGEAVGFLNLTDARQMALCIKKRKKRHTKRVAVNP